MPISRRQLALAALAASSSTSMPKKTAAAPPETAYGGPLEKFSGKYQPADFDSLAYSRERWKESPRALRFQAHSKKEAVAWQKKLRARVAECLGEFPKTHCALNARTLEAQDLATHRREALLFDSRPGLSVFGYLLTPAGAKGPLPVVICLPGHGRGVDDISGIAPDGSDRTKKAGYQFDYAVQVVEHGMAALAMEPLGFGCRRDPEARKKGAEASSCQPSAGAALLVGETMAGWRSWDVMRACDWIATRPELDASRIGCIGISGGGTVTLYAAALEPRIRAAFMSCSLCLFRDCILSISHCIDNYVPGTLKWGEMSDIAGLIAPRPLFVESGLEDPIFPLAGSREAFEEVRRVYDTFGQPERCGREEFAGGHEFHGVQGLEFLRRQLGA
ncbi:MAG: alpha/beta hydrolase family protein [Bryobacteraceae bacterium]